MRLTPSSDYLPAPGHTVTATYLHNLVDNATLGQFTADDFSDAAGDGLLVGSNPTTTHYWLNQTDDVYAQVHSAVSLTNPGLRALLAKCDVVYFESAHGNQPYKGMMCGVPHVMDKSRGSWSSWSNYSLASHWYLPRASIDNITQGDFYVPAVPSQYTGIYWTHVWGVVDEDLGGSSGLLKMATYGFCQALVHASLSNELSLPGAIYGLAWEGTTTDVLLPAAINYTDPSYYTLTAIPLGLVRKVYTESGITQVPMVYDNEASATNCPYYVAEVFLGGFPCL